MWFSEKALVFVDTRSAALAVYKETFSGPRLVRFAFEHFGSKAREGGLFADVLSDSREAIGRLARDLKAPSQASLLLPIGVTYPSIVETASLGRGKADVSQEDLIRFRIAPLLPFPVNLAEVRSEAAASLGPGVVLAQAILKTTIIEGERVMEAIGFRRPRVTSALSAALRGLPPQPGVIDLIFGDSACAIAVRDQGGAVEAIHLRLLVEGDDRAQRSMDEAFRAAKVAKDIRVLGEDAVALASKAGDVKVRPAFDEKALRGSSDPQAFPFLAVFHQGAR